MQEKLKYVYTLRCGIVKQRNIFNTNHFNIKISQSAVFEVPTTSQLLLVAQKLGSFSELKTENLLIWKQ